MLDDSSIALIGLILAVCGQYPVLYAMNSKIDAIKMEFATCPYHAKGKHPAGDD